MPNTIRMDVLMYLIAVIIIRICDSSTSECSQKNKLCDHMKIDNGYNYTFDINEDINATEIEVYCNQTLIAYGSTKLFQHKPEVISMDKQYVITKTCQNLTVKFFYPNGKFLAESCVEYNVTENKKNPDSLPPWALGIIIAAGVLVVLGIIGFILYCRCISQRNQPPEQQRSDTFPGMFSCWSCRNEGISQSRGSRTEVQGDRRNDSVPESSSFNTHVNSPSGRPSDTDAHAGDENDIEQKQILCSIDPGTAEALKLSTTGIQPSNDKDSVSISVLDVSVSWSPRAMNMRDDPGGLADNMNREEVTESALGDQTDEGEALLWNMRNAVQGVDVTDEAAVLVDKHGFDPNQASRCSAARDKGSIDVESRPPKGRTII